MKLSIIKILSVFLLAVVAVIAFRSVAANACGALIPPVAPLGGYIATVPPVGGVVAPVAPLGGYIATVPPVGGVIPPVVC